MTAESAVAQKSALEAAAKGDIQRPSERRAAQVLRIMSTTPLRPIVRRAECDGLVLGSKSLRVMQGLGGQQPDDFANFQQGGGRPAQYGGGGGGGYQGAGGSDG